ncbi:VWA domain-containing protein [Alphaproteobacteria bacterium]|nr:VWA domain-containing protein [Alphaproteobacteria bacterium]
MRWLGRRLRLSCVSFLISFLALSLYLGMAFDAVAQDNAAQDSTAVQDNAAISAVGKTIIVYDLSGSMALGLDGRVKSKTVQKALLSGLKDLDHVLEVGLVAFGHRSRSSCSDLQLAVPMGQRLHSLEQIETFLGGAKPQGRAPVAAALRLAGSRLKIGEPNQSLILIADGSDSCQENPCDVVDHLFDKGLGFKGYVVGVGVDDNQFEAIKCVADKSDGEAINAKSSEEVVTALASLLGSIDLEAETFSVSPLRKALGRKTEKNLELMALLAETRDELKKEKLSHSKTKNALTAALKEEAERTVELDQVTSDKNVLETILDEEEAVVNGLLEQQDIRMQEIETTKSSLLEVEDQIKLLEQLVVDLREENENLRTAFEDLVNKKEADDNANDLRIAELNSQNTSLGTVLAAIRKKHETYVGKSSALLKWAEQDRDGFQQEGQHLKADIVGMQDELKELMQQLSATGDELVESRSQTEDEKSHSRALSEMIEKLKAQERQVQRRLLTALTSLRNSLEISSSLMHLLPETSHEQGAVPQTVEDFCVHYSEFFSTTQLTDLGC